MTEKSIENNSMRTSLLRIFICKLELIQKSKIKLKLK